MTLLKHQTALNKCSCRFKNSVHEVIVNAALGGAHGRDGQYKRFKQREEH